MIITIILVIAYFGGMLILFFSGILETKELITNLTIAFGWIVALLIAIIYLRKARKDNQLLKNDEIKKKLEIEAFKEINRALYKFSSKIGNLSIIFSSLPRKFDLYKENPNIFKFDKIKINQEILYKGVELSGAFADFILTIESNEITVLKFDHYRKYIHFMMEDFREEVRKFEMYFTKVEINKLIDKDAFSEFKSKCNLLSENSNLIQCYLFDYRIILMNYVLGEIFKSYVPERKPKDPSFKLLSEVAVKEEVEKEEERRINASIKRKK